MADFHGFRKPVDPAFEKFDREDGGIVEFTNSALIYQMLPVGGLRMISATSPADLACVVEIAKPLAEFGRRTFTSTVSPAPFVPPPTPDRFRQALPAGMHMVFEVRGLAAGHTEIVLRAAGGGPLASMRLSVKSEVMVTMSACRLTDIVTENPFTENEIRACVARAKEIYRNTANVTLIDDPTIYHVESDIELGNPIVLGKQITEYSSEDSTVLRHIRAKVPPAARAARFVCIFGWDFEITHAPLVGVQIGQLCFVEWNTSDRSRAMTLEHELGHAMGLGHTAVFSIMAGSGIEGIERFEEAHIEILNKTGNTP
ncbi:MAG: hypothetical protein R3E51_17970 [Rhizobiaceae bacterium]